MFSRRLFMSKLGLLGLAAGGCGDGSPFYPLRPRQGAHPIGPEPEDAGPVASPPDMGVDQAVDPNVDPAALKAAPAPDASCSGTSVPMAANYLPVNQAFLTEQLVNGQSVTVFVVRDPSGFFAVSGKCTHMGCITYFNPDARTLDCPCHGSRYELTGKVKNGPAPMSLPRHPLCRGADGLLLVDYTTMLPGV